MGAQCASEGGCGLLKRDRDPAVVGTDEKGADEQGAEEKGAEEKGAEEKGADKNGADKNDADKNPENTGNSMFGRFFAKDSSEGGADKADADKNPENTGSSMFGRFFAKDSSEGGADQKGADEKGADKSDADKKDARRPGMFDRFFAKDPSEGGVDEKGADKDARWPSMFDTSVLAGLFAKEDPNAKREKAMAEKWPAFEEKMKQEGLNEAAIAAFKYNLGVLLSGASTMIPETSIGPVESLPTLESLDVAPDPALLKETVMLKLNGGLGTGMGLDKAKSLLQVADGNSFLDLIAQQVAAMKKEYNTDLSFMLMNSFSTSKDTLEALGKYPELGTGSDLEFVQNKAPKVVAADMTPAAWPAEQGHEWCPPGHGDLYPALLGSGTLDRLLEKGFKYMFVSNSDNLGATMDLKLLTHFASSKAPFMMEVCTRTDADKKGGHLAKDSSTGGLLLRESAQCPEEDEKAFQDVTKYTFFNTNNLWVDLVALKAIFDKHGGAIPLPVMKNSKTVDPRDKASTPVLQLETAMGAAISCFEGAAAIVIPRERFAPVKTTSDLVALRSDAYRVTEDFRITLAPSREGVPPTVKLDGRYKFVDAMETLIPAGAPSLVGCKSLTVEGEVTFAQGVVFKGSVVVKNGGDGLKTLSAGTYGSDGGDPVVVEL